MPVGFARLPRPAAARNRADFAGYAQDGDRNGPMREADDRALPHCSDAVMLYGLYLSSQGAQTRASQLEVVSNNLANASTNGFKKSLALFQAHSPFEHAAATRSQNSLNPPGGNLDGQTGGVTLAGTATDFSQGPLNQTGGSLDVALNGSGFFRVDNGTEQLLTRDGRFATNANGELVTQDGGLRALTQDGKSLVLSRDAAETRIAEDGTVSQRLATGETAVVGRLAVVAPQTPNAVERLGDGLYRATGDVRPAGPETRVAQGYVESSGVNPVSETLQMIEASRAFEMNTNMLRFQDDSLARLLSAARP